MRVISKTRLTEYWLRHAAAKNPLTNWYNHVSKKTTIWASFADVRKDYSSVDEVGDCYVFDIGGNNFRLIANIVRERVYIRKLMTHAEYNDQTWIVECKCHRALRTNRPKAAKKASKKSVKKTRGKR